MQELRALYDSILSERIQKYQQDQADRADGIVRIDENTARFLNGITDEVLRQFVEKVVVHETQRDADCGSSLTLPISKSRNYPAKSF